MAVNARAYVIVTKNRFPELGRQIEQNIADAVEDVAQDMASSAKGLCSSGAVRSTITVERRQEGAGPATRYVVAGQRRAGFWAGFIEYGTQDQGAHPFMTPAAELGRATLSAKLRNLMR